MRVLLIPSSYPPVLGGLQTVSHNLARGLTRLGHTVRVITNRYPRSLPAGEQMDQVPIRRLLFLKPSFAHLKQRRLDLLLASFWFYPATLLELKRLMKRFRPEVVNVHYPLSQIPFILALRQRYRFRLVVSLHGDDLLPWVRNGTDNPGLRAILLQADAVTACSQWLLDQAIEWEPSVKNKGVAIHNGIDPDRFEDKTFYPHPRHYILAYGRLSYQKGFDMLLEAFAQVALKNPDVDLILAGDGEEREHLIAQTRRLGLGGRVIFFGRATPEEVVQLLNGCQFVVVPSRWEPFGIVALEALAAGKPVLATRVGGVVELYEQSKGRLHLADPTQEGIAQMLMFLLKRSVDVQKKYISFARIRSDFSWERVVVDYEKVLSVA
ncbi:MAG: glycosyltransferase family 4 protein [Chloroflexota bacterium]